MYSLLASSGVTSASILETGTSLLTWALSSMTSIMTWALENPYMILVMLMFIVGFVVSLLVRVIYSL